MRNKKIHSERTATEYIIFNHHRGNSHIHKIVHLHFGSIEFRLDEIKMKEKKNSLSGSRSVFLSHSFSQNVIFGLKRHSPFRKSQFIWFFRRKQNTCEFFFFLLFLHLIHDYVFTSATVLLLLLLLLFLPFIHSCSLLLTSAPVYTCIRRTEKCSSVCTQNDKEMQ